MQTSPLSASFMCGASTCSEVRALLARSESERPLMATSLGFPLQKSRFLRAKPGWDLDQQRQAPACTSRSREHSSPWFPEWLAWYLRFRPTRKRASYCLKCGIFLSNPVKWARLQYRTTVWFWYSASILAGWRRSFCAWHRSFLP